MGNLYKNLEQITEKVGKNMNAQLKSVAATAPKPIAAEPPKPPALRTFSLQNSRLKAALQRVEEERNPKRPVTPPPLPPTGSSETPVSTENSQKQNTIANFQRMMKSLETSQDEKLKPIIKTLLINYKAYKKNNYEQEKRLFSKPKELKVPDEADYVLFSLYKMIIENVSLVSWPRITTRLGAVTITKESMVDKITIFFNTAFSELKVPEDLEYKMAMEFQTNPVFKNLFDFLNGPTQQASSSNGKTRRSRRTRRRKNRRKTRRV